MLNYPEHNPCDVIQVNPKYLKYPKSLLHNVRICQNNEWLRLDDIKNSGIFKTMKRQWNILITGFWLDGINYHARLVRTNWGWHGLIFVIVLCMFWALQWQRLLCPRLQGNQRRDSTDRWRHRDPCVVLDTNLVTKTSLEEMYGIWENWRRRENCQMACRWIYQSSSTGTYLVSLEAAVCGTYIAAGYGCKQRNQLIGWAYIHEHINFEPVFSYL
jgi:hypothetical protein